MTASSSFVCHGPIITGLMTTDGKSLVVASVLAATLASFATATNGNGVGVTNGSPDITFAANQTLAAGTPLVFASQPNVTYFLEAAVTAGTAGVLTQNYSGTTNSATFATNIFSATYTSAGSSPFTFTSSTDQTLPIGFQFTINGGAGSFAGIVGTLTTAVSGADTLPAASVSYNSAPSLVNSTLYTLVAAPLTTGGYGGVLTLATPVGEGDLDSTNPPVLEVVQRNGSRARITTEAWGNVAATDHVLVAAAGGTYTLVGADRQPIFLVALPPSSLVA
jgi:hypothetical protein